VPSRKELQKFIRGLNKQLSTDDPAIANMIHNIKLLHEKHETHSAGVVHTPYT